MTESGVHKEDRYGVETNISICILCIWHMLLILFWYYFTDNLRKKNVKLIRLLVAPLTGSVTGDKKQVQQVRRHKYNLENYWWK